MMTTSTELDTTPRSLPAAFDDLGPTPRPGRRWWLAGIASALLLAATIAAAVVPLPYIAIMPGAARPVSELIVVEGAPFFEPAESIAFTTVTAREATLFDALRGWLDDEIDVFPDNTIRQDRSEEENRELNQQLMADSKVIAQAVALRHLGYVVDVRLDGVGVQQVADDFPAASAGLEVGDVIVAIDGEEVDEHDELGQLLQVGGPGAEHVVTVERPGGSDHKLELRMGTVASEADPARAIIGIEPVERITNFVFPIDVSIDSGSVGGPSAGLAFTLAVIDVLTEGELTGGLRVATTGTIELDASVGPVGGALQKAVTVRNAGYEVFLVPSDEYEVVQAAIGADVRVIAVDTLVEALDALESLGGNAASLEPAVAAAS